MQKIASHSEFILQSKDLEDISRNGCISKLFKSKIVQKDKEVALLEAELWFSVISPAIPFWCCCDLIKYFVHRGQWHFTYWKGYLENRERSDLCKNRWYNNTQGVWKRNWKNCSQCLNLSLLPWDLTCWITQARDYHSEILFNAHDSVKKYIFREAECHSI